ncbi:YetF domain-containing protein [Ectobacillus sp. JY-23]|uniref:YetF domain-containing protein n=1 Tax=Ectobacillus sp. JY-23 TaxID=2933872 RepID=UPI0034A06845
MWTPLIYTTEVVTQKSRRLRIFLRGNLCLLSKIENSIGKSSKNHLHIDQLMQLLQAKDIFSLQEVEHAVLEKDGTVSVLRNAAYDSVIKQDLKLPQQDVLLPIILVSDEQIRQDTLKENGLLHGCIEEYRRIKTLN